MTDSPAAAFVRALAAELGPGAVDALEVMLGQLTVVELAALAHDWGGWWARPAQVFPTDTDWKSITLLAARAYGKTRATCEYVVGEAQAGRAMRIALVAQTLERTESILVTGESGLLACSPPWFRARYEPGAARVTWPNGARAFLYSAHEPDGLRGPEHHLAVAEEVTAWAQASREATLANLDLGVRLEPARTIFACTPRRRDSVVRALLVRAMQDPVRHRIVRGSTHENLAIPRHVIEGWEREYGSSMRGREEIGGEYLDDSAGALWRSAWIERSRRALPARLARRMIAIDPAISTRKGTDRTGIVELGLGEDGQVYVIADHSGRYGPEQWGHLVVDIYARRQCDAVIVERNRGGDLLVANLRAQAAGIGLSVIVVAAGAPTRHDPRTVYVIETFSTRDKSTRHEPCATLYERGRVSHVLGANLGELEDTMLTWEPTPGAQSPDALDALVSGVAELAALTADVGRPGTLPEGHSFAFGGCPDSLVAPERPVEPLQPQSRESLPSFTFGRRSDSRGFT